MQIKSPRVLTMHL